MNIDTRDYNEDNEINVNCGVITITDKDGNTYEIQEIENRKGLQIRTKNGYVVIKPVCDNVMFVTVDEW